MISIKSWSAILVLLLSMAAVSNVLAEGNPIRPDTLAAGEVMKVDLSRGRITIRHGPIKRLGMNAPQAADEFVAKEPIMLNALRPGDKINFSADRVNGQLTILTIEPPK